MYEPYCSYYYSDYENSSAIPIETITNSNKKSIRRSKHIPHHLRPQHIVEKRNTRERQRVQDVNRAFLILKSLLPFEINYDDNTDQLNNPRISKVRTLRKAVDYIIALQNLLNQTN